MSERGSGLSLSVVVQMLIAAGIWLLVLDGWNGGGESPEAGIMDSTRVAEVTADDGRGSGLDGDRIEEKLNRLAAAVSEASAQAEQRVPVAAPISVDGQGQVNLPADLATMLRDLNETLKLIRVKAAPLGGGRVDFESLQVAKMNRELVAKLHATVRQDRSAACDRYILKSVKSVLAELGKPLRITSEDGLEAWHYSLRHGQEGVSFVVRDGLVTDLGLGW